MDTTPPILLPRVFLKLLNLHDPLQSFFKYVFIMLVTHISNKTLDPIGFNGKNITSVA